MPSYVYKNTKLVRVVDGDTVDVEITVDIGFNISASHKIRLRIKNLDTPETYRPSCDAEKDHGKRATEYAKTLLENTQFTIRTYKLGKYGRYEADIFFDNGNDYAEAMKSAGFEKKESYDSIA
jgi:micrococcal nuclease